MLKLIAFDWDDVITLGSTAGYLKCYHETMLELGIDLGLAEEQERIFSRWSQPHRREFEALLAERLDLVDRACQIYKQKLFGDTFVDSLSVNPGTIELLERLSQRYRLAVATGMNPIILKEKIFPRFQIPPVFSQLLFGYDIIDPVQQKPGPYMLEEIMRRESVLPTEMIYVGDANTDVQMARNAGVTPVVVLTGHLNRAEAEALGVEKIIENVMDLESIIHEWQS